MCHAAAANLWLYGLTVSTLSALMHVQPLWWINVNVNKNTNNGGAGPKIGPAPIRSSSGPARSRTSNRTGAISSSDSCQIHGYVMLFVFEVPVISCLAWKLCEWQETLIEKFCIRNVLDTESCLHYLLPVKCNMHIISKLCHTRNLELMHSWTGNF